MASEKKGLFGLLGFLGKKATSEPEAPQPTKDWSVSGQPYLPKIGSTHRIAGVSYRTDNVMKLASANPYYDFDKAALLKKGYTDMKIFKYSFITAPVTLEQEPDNPHDPHAIKVLVAGLHIGYIKAGSCAHVNKLINEKRIEKINCRFFRCRKANSISFG